MLLDAIRSGLLRNPAAPAFVFRDRVLSAGAFFGLYCEVGRRLRDEGIAAGEVVGVSMDQSPLHCAVLLALARLGAVSMPLHPGSSAEQRGRLSERFGSTRSICSKDIDAPSGCSVIGLDKLRVRASDDDSHLGDFVPHDTSPARIAFTSGTTGDPSAILYSHGYWHRRIERTVDGVGADSRVIPVDLHLTLGNLFAFAALCAGGLVVFPRRQTPQDLAAAINLHAVTHVLLPPGTVSATAPLLHAQGIAFPTLEHMRIIGGRVPAAMLETLRTRFSPKVFVPYGISEVGPITMATPEILEACPDCSGVVRAGVECEIVGADGAPLPAGESGAIRVRMPEMPVGYHLDAARTAEKFREGWFQTGDIGRIDAQGRLFVEGREDDRLNVGGRKFHPAGVERVLAQCPGVSEAVVFPMEAETGTAFLAAAVICDSMEALQALPRFCKANGVGALTPRRYFRVKDFPRNPAGKVLRRELPALLSARRPGAAHAN